MLLASIRKCLPGDPIFFSHFLKAHKCLWVLSHTPWGLDAHVDAVDDFGNQYFVAEDKLSKAAVWHVDNAGLRHSGCRISGELVVQKIKGNKLVAPPSVAR